MRIWLCGAAVNGFVAVAAGAFAAHALEGRLSAQALEWIATAARYQMAHALALLAVAWLVERSASGASRRSRLAAVAGWCFLAGSLLFCVTLYAMALTGLRALGAIVPFGGLAFLLGWATLLIHGLRAGPR